MGLTCQGRTSTSHLDGTTVLRISWVSLPETKRAESSAYKSSLQRTAVLISLIYIRNNNGPRIEPCGTPHVTVIGLEIASPISTDC